MNWSKLVKGGTSVIVFAMLLGGCASQSTKDYNLCALGMGAAGLGVDLACRGTGSLVLATGAGARSGYLVRGEDLPAPVAEPSVYVLLPLGDQTGQRVDQVAAKATGMDIALRGFDATDFEAGRGLIAGKGHRPGTEIAIRSRIKEQDFHPVVPIV